MNLLAKDQLKSLIEEHEKPCVSIYMPTVKSGAEVQQNSARFKNLIRKVEDDLKEVGLGGQNIKSFLQPAWDLVSDEVFWQNQSHGLASFISPDYFENFRLPANFEENTIVSTHFHVKPIVPLFSLNARFFMLAISQAEVRVMEGTQFKVDVIDIDALPNSLVEALRWDDPEEHLHYHSSEGPSTGGKMPETMFHGHGVTEDKKAKNNVLRYFQKIDQGIQALLAEERIPLILAGVDYLHPIYKEANSYRYMIDEGIQGNPEELRPEEIHRKAWEIVEPYFLEQEKESIDRYKTLKGMETGRTSIDLQEIIPAAFRGQIETLFIQKGEEAWGAYDWASTELNLDDGPTGENRDLIDLAAAQTFINDGVVFVMEPHKMPDAAQLAAIYRY